MKIILNNPVLNIDEYGLGILNVIGNLFKRLVGAISSIGSECNCTRTQESVGDAWRRADFPKLNEAIDDLFSKGSSGTKKKSTTEGEGTKIEGMSLGSIGFIVNKEPHFDTPKINISTPVSSSVNKMNNSLLAAGTKIDINVKFFSNSPTINSANSDKTLNDLLKTLIDYP